ncbi:hypothetical protein ACLOJK_033615 [Asimina triloba]
MEKTTRETLTTARVGNGASKEDAVWRERGGGGGGETATELGNGEDDGGDTPDGRKYRGGRWMQSRTGEGDEETRRELLGETVGREGEACGLRLSPQSHLPSLWLPEDGRWDDPSHPSVGHHAQRRRREAGIRSCTNASHESIPAPHKSLSQKQSS